MKRFHTQANTLLIITVFLLSLSQAVSAKGPRNKITVESANPPEATQGIEETVDVFGTGFDQESMVSYLVTGTTDASQVDVLSVEYVSSTQLRTKIRPKDAALVTDYDIEVRTSSGRKGKGTTLFRVKQADTECTGFESKEPEIVYSTALELTGDFYTSDIYLSSSSGCDQYLLLENAMVAIPSGGIPGEYLARIAYLRLDVEGSLGVVTWSDMTSESREVFATRFEAIDGGGISLLAGPEMIYAAPDGYSVYQPDPRLNELGELELITNEASPDKSHWRLAHVNVHAGVRTTVSSGHCPYQNSEEMCFYPAYSRPYWNVDGSLVYLSPGSWPDGESMALVQISREVGFWQPGKVLMTNPGHLGFLGVNSGGILAYEWVEQLIRRKGKSSKEESRWVVSTLNPDLCLSSECLPVDGLETAADATKFPNGWTRDGGMLYTETGPGSQRNIQKYLGPFLDEVGDLRIENFERGHRDTTY